MDLPAPGPSLSRTRAVSRREELLAVAARLFAASGFAGVTTDDIGAAAGVSGPALYHHFAGKEAMLGEMLVSISEHLDAQARAIVDATPDPNEALDALLRAQVAFAVDHPELITVHVRDLVRAPEADRRRIRRLQARYVGRWVDVLVRRGPAADDKLARTAVHAVLGLVNSTPHIPLADRAQAIELLQAMARGALAAFPASRPGPG